jgi:putative transposase
MREDTSKQKAKASVKPEPVVELSLPLEELVRRGARDILRQAIEVEVQTVLDEYADVQLLDGRQAVVRNGYLPRRELLELR